MSERPAASTVMGQGRTTTERHRRDDREGAALLATVLLGVTLSLLTTPLVVGALVAVPLMVLISVVTRR